MQMMNFCHSMQLPSDDYLLSLKTFVLDKPGQHKLAQIQIRTTDSTKETQHL